MPEDFTKPQPHTDNGRRKSRWLRVAALSIGFLAMGTGLSACYVAPYRPYYAAPGYYHPGYYHPGYYSGYGYYYR